MDDYNDIEDEINKIDEAIDSLRAVSSSETINLNFQREIDLLLGEKRDLEEELDNVKPEISSDAVEDSIKEFSIIEDIELDEAREKAIEILSKDSKDVTDITSLYRMYSSRDDLPEDDNKLAQDIKEYLVSED